MSVAFGDITFKTTMMKYTLLLWILLLPAVGNAQSAALKFDEFTSDATPSYFFDDDISFKERLDRFIRQLKLERPTTKVYLIHYQDRVSQYRAYDPAEWRADRARWEITSRTTISQENVQVINGGIRDSDTLEFWIGRRNAPAPKPTPTYAASEAVVCPSIWLNEQGFHFDDNEAATFSAAVEPKADRKFTWIVSSGKILDGQGTEKISVDVKGIKSLKISLLVDGIPNECVRETSQVFRIGPRPLLQDEFGRTNESEIRGRLDSFLATVSQNPSLKGYMILYGRRSQPLTLDALQRLVRNQFAFRRFPTDRIDVVKGGYRDDSGMQLWLIPPGVDPPPASPTVDSSFVGPARAARRRRP